jgi:lysophospholipid acyltransferase (LPLAT)-like uncharacterized protein
MYAGCLLMYIVRIFFLGILRILRVVCRIKREIRYTCFSCYDDQNEIDANWHRYVQVILKTIMRFRVGSGKICFELGSSFFSG